MGAVSQATKRVLFACSLLAMLTTAAAAAPPAPAPKASPTPSIRRPPGAMQPIGGVQSGEMPLPDLALTKLEYIPGEKKGTNSDGTSCYSFGLKVYFKNIGEVGTGAFRVVWEKAKSQEGPFEPACPSCSMPFPDVPPSPSGTSMLAERGTTNCQEYRWFRVRLDPDQNVIELREDNNFELQFH